MFLDHEHPFRDNVLIERLMGPNPPVGVYFVMEFSHNLDHPLNKALEPSKRSFESAPQRTMDEARIIANIAAKDFADKNGLSLIAEEMSIEDDEVTLPVYTGLDPYGDDLDDEENIVFTAMVKIIDYRNETIH